MTVGVLWEFFEFSMDWFFGLDMQKDWILPSINSVKLNPTGAKCSGACGRPVSGDQWRKNGIWVDIWISESWIR